MADPKPPVICDLLCFAINKFSRVPMKPLKMIVNDFYSPDDICNAKDLLIDEVEVLNIENWAKPPRRRKDSITRTQNEVDDIFSAISSLDEGLNLHKLPTFVSSDPDRMPSVKLNDGDLAALLLKLNAIETNVSEIKAATCQLLAMKHLATGQAPKQGSLRTRGKPGANSRDQVDAGTVSVECPLQSVSFIPGPSSRPSESDGAPMQQGLTSSGDDDSTANNDFTEVSRRKRHKKSSSPNLSSSQAVASSATRKTYASLVSSPAPRLTVSRPSVKPKPLTVIGASNSSALKASKTLAVKKAVFCVGNIDSSYTSSNVEDYISGVGVRVLSCFELKPSASQPDSKAFRVCIVAEDKAIFCHRDNWFVGVSVREWVHKPKSDPLPLADSAVKVSAAPSNQGSVTIPVQSTVSNNG